MLIPIYMQVSKDEFQIPEFVSDSIAELSQMTGASKDYIKNEIWRADKGKIKPRFVRVYLEEEVET